MIISDKDTGLYISPNYDSGSYMGSFTVVHEDLKHISYDDPKMIALQVLIASAVSKVFDEGKNDESKQTN